MIQTLEPVVCITNHHVSNQKKNGIQSAITIGRKKSMYVWNATNAQGYNLNTK